MARSRLLSARVSGPSVQRDARLTDIDELSITEIWPTPVEMVYLNRAPAAAAVVAEPIYVAAMLALLQ